MFVHADKAGLRVRSWWRDAGNMTGLGSLWSEKQGSHFFHQEDKNTDNAQDDGDAAHGDDGSSQLIENAAPRETC
jgi:hypothetical protein